MKVIYVAGAYRGGSMNKTFQNIMKARDVAQRLWYQGWAVICPHTNSFFMDESNEGSPEIFLPGDLEILSRCDAIYMLKGWRDSEGATGELDLAQKLGLDIYYERHAVLDEKPYNQY